MKYDMKPYEDNKDHPLVVFLMSFYRKHKASSATIPESWYNFLKNTTKDTPGILVQETLRRMALDRKVDSKLRGEELYDAVMNADFGSLVNEINDTAKSAKIDFPKAMEAVFRKWRIIPKPGETAEEYGDVEVEVDYCHTEHGVLRYVMSRKIPVVVPIPNLFVRECCGPDKTDEQIYNAYVKLRDNAFIYENDVTRSPKTLLQHKKLREHFRNLFSLGNQPMVDISKSSLTGIAGFIPISSKSATLVSDEGVVSYHFNPPEPNQCLVNGFSETEAGRKTDFWSKLEARFRPRTGPRSGVTRDMRLCFPVYSMKTNRMLDEKGITDYGGDTRITSRICNDAYAESHVDQTAAQYRKNVVDFLRQVHARITSRMDFEAEHKKIITSLIKPKEAETDEKITATAEPA